MSEKEKKIIEELADKLPAMSERERGYLEGTIATAAAMSKKKKKRWIRKNEVIQNANDQSTSHCRTGTYL